MEAGGSEAHVSLAVLLELGMLSQALWVGGRSWKAGPTEVVQVN